MKLEINELGSRDFYEEILYLSLNRRNILRNKNYKVHKVNDYYRMYIIYSILAALLMIVFYFMFKNGIFLMMAGMAIFLIVYELLSVNNFNKYIEAIMSQDKAKTIEINEDGVSYSDGERSLSLDWNAVHSVIKGKYSISFFPKNESDYMISLDKKYADEVIEALKANNMDVLLKDKE